MALKYEGNTNLNFNTYLDNYGFAKDEINAAVRQMTMTGRAVDTVGVLRDGNFPMFDVPAAEIDMALAYLDYTGDLRFLDHVHRLISASHESWKNDWQLKTDGTKATAWDESKRFVGKRRWLFKWRSTDIGKPDPAVYGTDLVEPDQWLWHSVYATAALAMINNAGKRSPAGYNYQATSQTMLAYLLNDFEALAKSRGRVRPVGKVGAGAINLDSRLHRVVVARARYHQAMYILTGREIDRTMTELVGGWAKAGFDFRKTLGYQLVGWPVWNKAGLLDLNQSQTEPYVWEGTNLASYTVTGSYHLWLLGHEDFTEDLLKAMANSFFYQILVDGPKKAPASDVGGGGPIGVSVPLNDRTLMKVRGAPEIDAAYAVIAAGGVTKSRWSGTEMMKFAYGITQRFAAVAHTTEYAAFRDTYDTLATGKYFNDKVAIGMKHLARGSWTRPADEVITEPPPPPVEEEKPEDEVAEENPPVDEDAYPPEPETDIPPVVGDGEGVEPEIVLPGTKLIPEIKDPHIIEPYKAETLGVIVYDRNWRVLDRIIGGGSKNEISSAQTTIEPNGYSGLCKSASLMVSRFLNVPPTANIQILVNGLPRFLGKVTKPPQPRVQRFSADGDPISLRTKFYFVSSRTGKPYVSRRYFNKYEHKREVVKQRYETNPGLALKNETEVFEDTVNYSVEGLKSLANNILLYNKAFENQKISDIVRDVALEFCSKTEVIFDPALISNMEYVTIKQEFDGQTVLAALDSLAQLAGNVTWGVDAYGRFFFLRREGAKIYNYHLDRNPVKLDNLEISTEELVNAVVVTGSSFGSSGKQLRSGYVINQESILEHGRYEKSYDYPSAVSEVGIPANVAAVLLERPRPVPIYAGVGYDSPVTDEDTAEYLLGVQNEINLRDGNFDTYAMLPGDNSDGTPALIQGGGYNATIFFEPQYANQITILQGEQDAGTAPVVEDDGIFTPDGKYLSPFTDRYLAKARGLGRTARAISIYNDGKLIWSGSNLDGKIQAEFEKQLVTKLTVVFDDPPTSGKIYWREISLLLVGKNDLVRYAENILEALRRPVVTASFDYPPDQYFDPPFGIVVTDFNGLTFNYEVSEVTFKFEGGVTASGKIGRGQINLQNLLASQKQAGEAAQKRLKNIDDELERRTRLVVAYAKDVAAGKTPRTENWMDGTGVTLADRNFTNTPLEEIPVRFEDV